MVNYSSIQEIRKLLEENRLSMSKQRGQNFLISTAAREKIAVEVLNGNPEVIWEVGPGIGNLTSSITAGMKTEQKIILFEFDYGFCGIIEKVFAEQNNLQLVKGDFLKTFNDESLSVPGCICGNLPYNVGSVIIMEILKSSLAPGKLVFMLQKEVARRIAAKPGSPEYSAFSLHCQLEWTPRILMTVPPGSFYPSPNVSSSVIILDRKKESFERKKYYFALVDAVFASRRKTIRNNLKKADIGISVDRLFNAFDKCGIDCGLRAEKLSADQLKKIIETVFS